MQPEIRTSGIRLAAGKRLRMTLSDDKTAELWRSFMPRIQEISHRASGELISMQMYPFADFSGFTPDTVFEKWAAVEVTAPAPLPDGLELLTLAGGDYAVFTYRGAADRAEGFIRAIFTEWLPGAGLQPDNSRPHLAVMGDKYRGNAPESEEEFWIPVKQ